MLSKVGNIPRCYKTYDSIDSDHLCVAILSLYNFELLRTIIIIDIYRGKLWGACNDRTTLAVLFQPTVGCKGGRETVSANATTGTITVCYN